MPPARAVGVSDVCDMCVGGGGICGGMCSVCISVCVFRNTSAAVFLSSGQRAHSPLRFPSEGRHWVRGPLFCQDWEAIVP